MALQGIPKDGAPLYEIAPMLKPLVRIFGGMHGAMKDDEGTMLVQFDLKVPIEFGGETIPAGPMFVDNNAVIYTMSVGKVETDGGKNEDGIVIAPIYIEGENGRSEARPANIADFVTDILNTGQATPEEEKEFRAAISKDGKPKQDTKKPRSHKQGISRLTEKMLQLETTGKPYEVIMSGKGEHREVITRITLTYEQDGITLSKKQTPYDQAVHNSVATLWAAGNRVITPMQVAQVLYGTRQITPKRLETVEESIDKQRRTFVTLDFSQELRGKTAEYEGETVTAQNAYLETYMLNADKETIIATNGREMSGYVLKDAPVLYRHDCTTRQIVSYPQKILTAANEAVRSTDKTILIRDYLLKRIKTMGRKGSKLARQIRYETVYEAAGIENQTRTQRNRTNDTIKAYLNVFKEQELIASWTEYEENGSSHKLAGVSIKFDGDE